MESNPRLSSGVKYFPNRLVEKCLQLWRVTHGLVLAFCANNVDSHPPPRAL